MTTGRRQGNHGSALTKNTSLLIPIEHKFAEIIDQGTNILLESLPPGLIGNLNKFGLKLPTSHVLTNATSYVGDQAFVNAKSNHECALFPQMADHAPVTSRWRAGIPIAQHSNLAIGTWVGHMSSNGLWINDGSCHVGAFYSWDKAGALTLIDQFNSKGEVGYTTYHTHGSGYSGPAFNDPNQYRLILW